MPHPRAGRRSTARRPTRSSSAGRRLPRDRHDPLDVVHALRPQLDPTKGPFTWQSACTRQGQPHHDASPLAPSRSARLRTRRRRSCSGRVRRPSTRHTSPGAQSRALSTTGSPSRDAATGNPYAASVAPILAAKLFYPAATDTSVKFLDDGLLPVVGHRLRQGQSGDRHQLDRDPSRSRPRPGHRPAARTDRLRARRRRGLHGDAEQRPLRLLRTTCRRRPCSTGTLCRTPLSIASAYPATPTSPAASWRLNPPRTVNTRWAPQSRIPIPRAGGEPGQQRVLLVHPALQVGHPVRA